MKFVKVFSAQKKQSAQTSPIFNSFHLKKATKADSQNQSIKPVQPESPGHAAGLAQFCMSQPPIEAGGFPHGRPPAPWQDQ